MPIAWIKKLFGIGVPKGTPAPEKLAPNNVSTSEPQTAPRTKTCNYREHVMELDRSFCQLLYGSERIYLTPNEAQRNMAETFAKKISESNLDSNALPRKPNSLPLLLKLLKLDDVDNDDVASLLIKDPALTSQVLKTANMALFRINDKSVDTIESAILRLGLIGIKSVVTAATLQPVFQAKADDDSLNEVVWDWALKTGASLEVLTIVRGEDSASCYLLGLIPELAMLIVNQEIDRLESELDSQRGSELDSECVERILPMQRLGIYKRVAQRLCLHIRKEWGLPERFDEALNAMGDAMGQTGDALLYDAILLAQYALVSDAEEGPYDLQTFSLLTESGERLNQKVLDILHRD